MTKIEANEVKKIINKNGRYATYYQSKAQTLSVRVYTYINDHYDADAEHKAVVELLKMVGGRDYEIIHRTYQGFIHDTDIIFR